MNLNKLVCMILMCPVFALADSPSCEATYESGTIDISECPADRPWHCYTNYSCKDGSQYTVWGSCQSGIQFCW